MSKITLISFLIVAASMFPSISVSSPVEQDLRALGGIVACGGNHFSRLNKTELHTTVYILRNYNKVKSIRIKRMRIYDATGSILKDFNGATLPQSFNAVMGAGDNSLEPYQTAMYRTNELLDELTNNKRPIQVHFHWVSSDHRALAPEFVWVRTSRKRVQTGVDSGGNPVYSIKEERARHLNNCRHIKIFRRSHYKKVS